MELIRRPTTMKRGRSLERRGRLVDSPRSGWFLLYIVAGFTFVMQTSSAAGLVLIGSRAAIEDPVSEAGIVDLVAGNETEKDQLAPRILQFADVTAARPLAAIYPERTDRQISELQPKREPTTWVQIVGGVAIFFWVQRFRNFLG